jgi:hypothetical protein
MLARTLGILPNLRSNTAADSREVEQQKLGGIGRSQCKRGFVADRSAIVGFQFDPTERHRAGDEWPQEMPQLGRELLIAIADFFITP